MAAALLMAIVGLLFGACGETSEMSPNEAAAGANQAGSDAGECADGDTRECVGAGACRGGQLCTAQSWSPCDCGSVAMGGAPTVLGGTGAGGAPVAAAGHNAVGGAADGTAGGGGSSGAAGAGGGEECSGVAQRIILEPLGYRTVDPPWHLQPYNLDDVPQGFPPCPSGALDKLQCANSNAGQGLVVWTEDAEAPMPSVYAWGGLCPGAHGCGC